MFNQRYYRKTRFVLLADMLATVFVIGLTAIFGTSPGIRRLTHSRSRYFLQMLMLEFPHHSVISLQTGACCFLEVLVFTGHYLRVRRPLSSPHCY